MLAAVIPEALNAGVPFYGTPAAPELRRNINGPLCIQWAELDQRVNDTWPEYEADLKVHPADSVMHIYPAANHGFHKNSTSRQDEKQAERAWTRTVDFFKTHPG